MTAQPPGSKRTYPGQEIIYVLEGSLEYQIEGQPPNPGRVSTSPPVTTILSTRGWPSW